MATSEHHALQELVDANDQPVFALDRDLRYTAFNRAHAVVMRALYGADIALGGRLPDYQSVAADRLTSTANLERVLAGERVVATALSGEDESRRSFEVVHVPLTDTAGTVVGVAVRAYDVTERRRTEEQLRESEARLQATLDSTADGILAVDDSGRVLLANRRFADLWNIPDDILSSGDDAALLTFVVDQLADPEAFLSKLQSPCGSDANDVDTLSFKDGRVFERHSSATIQDSVVTGRVWSFGDITERRRQEEELLRTRRLLEEAQSISRLGGWQYDVAGDRVTWTDEVYRIHGVGPDFDPDKVDRDVDFYAPESAPRVAEAFRRAVEAGEPYDLEVELDRADGARIWVRTVGRPVVEDGHVVRVIGNIMDITERVIAERDLRESESRFRQLAESLPQLVWTCEPDGPCDYLSSQWVAYTGIPEAQQLGFGWMEQLHADDREPTMAAWEAAVAAGTDFHVEFRIRRHDGEHRWFDTQAVRLRDADGNTVKWFGSNTDVTERRRAEEEIISLNAELEQRVFTRTAQFDAANKELEAFAYSVSHDLRAPLRHISGFASILAEDCADSLGEDGRSCLDTITDSVRQMGVLIDDLLQFSRVGRVEMQVSDVDMEEILSEALKPIREEVAGRDIEWSIAPMPHVLGDHNLLRQVWANLVDNAVKYSRDRSPARIEIGTLDCDADPRECVFFVRDNGVGFDMRYVDKLFRVFQRLHDSAQFEGTGIGLAQVQRIVTRLGGRVWAEAELDKGATFGFALPRPREPR